MVQTLELDLHYWPTQVLTLKDGEWIRQVAPPTVGDARPQ